MNVVVTGASGKAVRAVVADLLPHDHQVLAVDLVPPADSQTSSVLADLTDFGHFIIAAADTVVDRPSAELMGEVYPKVRYRPTAGEHDTLLSIDKARRLLGYEPRWSWRDHV